MNVFRRAVGTLLLSTLLSACQQAPSHPTENITNLCQLQSEPGSASCKWADEMQHQLNRQFSDAGHYAGQQCMVRLEWQNSGRYAVTQTQGDETLCLRAWQLIGQSKGLPPPPDRTQPAWFGFAPHQASSPAHPGATDAG
ncbi:colicin transporter [Pantoea rodasii]|uniref:Colicin transporter n=1 Tax=Pantoea rodasii TaxID=1076549 RepID=A0A2M9WAF7_9GAMM|nr:cell envelope integrity TolA C-terminal domain-containing protein [Pantoea rodasii]ORM65736.1 colicin transporter [Pantoea rodasii]PJZ04515.1 colicin transporter [Pantoea rodasii]